jgi:hypothetical protein
VIDMETRQPIDVLPDREAETVQRWPAGHPEVEIICRDRAGAYASGAAKGAPQAIQVADRFHVWQNLGEAVDKIVFAHRGCLAEPAAADDTEADQAFMQTDLAEGATELSAVDDHGPEDPVVTPSSARLVERTRERCPRRARPPHGSTIAETLRDAIGSNTATTDSAAWAASQAHVSSNAAVNRAPGRAHGTCATITSWAGQDARCIRLPETLGSCPLQAPPPTPPATPVIARAPAPAPEHREDWPAFTRTPASSRSPCPSSASSTDSITVCSTPSTCRPGTAHGVGSMIVSSLRQARNVDSARRAPKAQVSDQQFRGAP